MKYIAVLFLFVGLALAAPKQKPVWLQKYEAREDDCLHCVEAIMAAVADCEVCFRGGVGVIGVTGFFFKGARGSSILVFQKQDLKKIHDREFAITFQYTVGPARF